MIESIDLDLADDEWQPPLTLSGKAWVLVRSGRHVLGEARVVGLSPSELFEHRTRLLRTYAPRLVSTRSEVLDGSQVTIVVCTRDRPRLLEGCLMAISSQEPKCAEIVVVDNAGTNPLTRDIAESFDAIVVAEPSAGLDRARNAGFRAASRPIVAYVDDDARVDRYFSGALGAAFRSPQIQVVTGLVLPAELDTFAQRAFEEIEGGMRKGFSPSIFERRRVGLQAFRVGVGTNMAFRRQLLEELGGFDPRFDVGTSIRGAGDLDMFWRCLNAGIAIVYDPNVLVRHIHRRDRLGLLHQMRDNGMAYSAFLESRRTEWPELAGAVNRERWRWHLSRHVMRPIAALLRGRFLEVQMALSELGGSRHGAAALRQETFRTQTP